jgi:hypothetical protein
MAKLSENLSAQSKDSWLSPDEMDLRIEKLFKEYGFTKREPKQHIPTGRLVATFHNPTKKKTTEPPTE